MLTFTSDRIITPAEFRDILERSTLGGRRPMDDESVLEGMIGNSNLVVSCWDDGRLVGIARSVTDFHFCCYLSDLAVDQSCQGQGIGRKLVDETVRRLGDSCSVVLLSAPAAVDYYPKLGFEKHPQAWVLAPKKKRVTDGDAQNG
ncbi:GNAT family N-acetyltransferase [Verrucomicrobiales bacterium BCK34]|nr:GNAT family N-acetyltransferase [Verrucomicrobiales bacterium BCK34]